MNVNPVKRLRVGLWEHSRSFNNCWHAELGYKIPVSGEVSGAGFVVRREVI